VAQLTAFEAIHERLIDRPEVELRFQNRDILLRSHSVSSFVESLSPLARWMTRSIDPPFGRPIDALSIDVSIVSLRAYGRGWCHPYFLPQHLSMAYGKWEKR
jgi:hypothetical protein